MFLIEVFFVPLKIFYFEFCRLTLKKVECRWATFKMCLNWHQTNRINVLFFFFFLLRPIKCFPDMISKTLKFNFCPLASTKIHSIHLTSYLRFKYASVRINPIHPELHEKWIQSEFEQFLSLVRLSHIHLALYLFISLDGKVLVSGPTIHSSLNVCYLFLFFYLSSICYRRVNMHIIEPSVAAATCKQS